MDYETLLRSAKQLLEQAATDRDSIPPYRFGEMAAMIEHALGETEPMDPEKAREASNKRITDEHLSELKRGL